MPSKDPEQRDRDQQILNRLAKIEHKVDSLEQTSAFALRPDADRHFESVKKIFKASQRRAQVYLAANGTRSVNEIADHLGMRYQNVSKELNALRVEGMLEITDSSGGTNLWGKTPIDRTLRITPFLTTEYRLTKDGKPAKK